MSKYSLLLASVFLFGSQVTADPIQNLVITSLTASLPEGPNGPISFFGSGPGVTISGSQGIISPNPVGPVGVPIGFVNMELPPVDSEPNLMLNGIIGGTTTVQLEGGGFISGSTDALVPLNGTVNVPASVDTVYSAFACGSTQLPPNCTGPQVANIFIDLDGFITLTYSAGIFASLNDTVLTQLSFANNPSVPEPSTGLLLLPGAALFLIIRSRRAVSSDLRASVRRTTL
jgi:hypothetical protein